MNTYYLQKIFLFSVTLTFIVLGFLAANPIFINDSYQWGIVFWILIFATYFHRNKEQRKIIYNHYIKTKGNFYTCLISVPTFWFILILNDKIIFLDKPISLQLFILLTLVMFSLGIVQKISPKKYEDYEKDHQKMWWPFN